MTMCGIAGIISLGGAIDKKRARELSEKLLLSIEDRGGDAAGIALIDTDKHKITVFKQPMTASRYVKLKTFAEIYDKGNYNAVLLHTRAASQGDPRNNKNNHPLYLKSNLSVLVHNGVLRNDDELKKQYGFNKDGEVDSEIILHMAEKFGVKKAIGRIEGSMAFALSLGNKVYLFRNNSNPLTMCYLPTQKLILFASRESDLEDAMSETRSYLGVFTEKVFKNEYSDAIMKECDANILYAIDLKNGKILTEEAEDGDDKKYGSWKTEKTLEQADGEMEIEAECAADMDADERIRRFTGGHVSMDYV